MDENADLIRSMGEEGQLPDYETRSEWISHLYEQYANDVLRVSYFYMGNRQQSEDVMQDVFIRLMESDTVLTPGKEKSWLLKVALNRCRDIWRSGWVKRVIVGSQQLEIIPAEDQIENSLEKEALMQAVHSLPSSIREVFLLFYYQNYGIDEIASILDVPPGTVSSRLARGRQKLKSLLEGGDEQC